MDTTSTVISKLSNGEGRKYFDHMYFEVPVHLKLYVKILNREYI